MIYGSQANLFVRFRVNTLVNYEAEGPGKAKNRAHGVFGFKSYFSKIRKPMWSQIKKGCWDWDISEAWPEIT